MQKQLLWFKWRASRFALLISVRYWGELCWLNVCCGNKWSWKLIHGLLAASPTLRVAMAFRTLKNIRSRGFFFPLCFPLLSVQVKRYLAFLTRDEINGSHDEFWLTEFLKIRKSHPHLLALPAIHLPVRCIHHLPECSGVFCKK